MNTTTAKIGVEKKWNIFYLLILSSIIGYSQTTAPGGVTSGLQHWLRADNPNISLAGTSMDFWPDASGNNRSMHKATGTTSPVLLSNNLNFNPVVYFDGTTAYTKTSAQLTHTFTSAYTAAEAFGFVKGVDNSNRGFPFDYGSSSRSSYWIYSNNALYDGFGSNVRLGYNPVSKAIAEAKAGAAIAGSFNPFEWGLYNVRSAANNWGVNHNSNTIVTSATNTVNFSYASTSRGVEIGINTEARWKGWMPEVALYNRVLNTNERNQVNTYFAIKYGMPLSHNFVSPSGAALWDRTTSAAYNNNFISIGRSDVQSLHQRQGRVWLNSGVLAVGNNNIIDLVKGNSSAAGNDIPTDESYLIIGDNNVSMAWTSTGAPAGQFSILSRTWRAQEVNTIGSVKLLFNTAGTTGATSFLPNAASANLGLYLIVSTDNIFTDASDVRTPMVYDATTKTWSVNVDLPAGASFFTIIKDLNGPGCVSAGPIWWFSADTPGTTPATVWQDLSGNEANVTAPANITFTSPASNTRSINFNPVYTFNGTNQYFSNSNYSFSNAAQEHFVVSFLGGTTNLREVVGVSAGQSFPYHAFRFNAGGFPVFSGATSTLNGSAIGTIALNNAVSLVHGGKNTTSSTNNSFIQFNGTQGQIFATNLITGPTSLLTVGAGRAGNSGSFTISNFFQGDLAEVVSFDQTLSTTDRQRVASYLAIKYGISLNHDYLSGKGVKVWDYTANTAYSNNIFAIGRDDCQALHQRQSKSSNSTGVISMGNNNVISTSNSTTNGNDITTNESFLIIGDNGQVPDWNYSSALTNANQLLTTVWKAQETGTIGSVKLNFFTGLSGTTSFIPAIAEATSKVFLLVSPDNNFTDSNNTRIPLTREGNNWAVNVDLNNGDFFTLTLDLAAPGGVATGLQHWLRTDNPSITLSGSSLDFWPDASGNSRSMYKATSTTSPTVLPNNLNFNPVVYFDGTTAYPKTSVQGLHTFTANNLAAEVFGFVKGADNLSRGYPFDYGGRSGSGGNHWIWTNNLLYESFASNTRIAFNPLTKAITEAKTGATVSGSFNPFEWGLYNVRSASNIWGINHNTNIIASGTTNTINFAYSSASNGVEIGSHGGTRWKGWMPELALYNRVLSLEERIKVNTYFAIKYGMPLTHNYIAPNGTTVLWDRTVNATYNNNIVSIGRSDVQSLHQRQGRTWLNSGMLTLGNNGIIDLVKGNSSTSGNDLANDESYLIIGDNNAAINFDYSLNLSQTYFYLFRKWKAEQTGTGGQVKLQVPAFGNSNANQLPDLSKISPLVVADAKLYLAIDPNGDGNWNDGTYTEATLTGAGTAAVYEANAIIPDGALFTFAVKKNLTDSDSDNVADLYDIDDDNDGAPDITENAAYGTFSVYTYNRTNDPLVAQNVPVRIAGSFTTDLILDQRTAGTYDYNLTKWKLLASNVYLSSDNKITITMLPELTTIVGSYVFADAMLITNGVNTWVIDDSQSGLTLGGSWINQAVAAGYLSNMRYTSTYTGRTATWTFTLPEAALDTDGDGLRNALDLDSDGDGCNDSFEAGASNVKTANYRLPGPYGANGLADAIESSTESGTIKYTSIFADYALNTSLNYCLDFDNDGISDIVDIDDDNDGVLDFEEQGKCVFATYDLSKLTFTGNGTVTAAGTTITSSHNVSNVWVTKYADQALKLPIHLEWTTNAAGNGIIGLLPEGNVKTISNWNDGAYKIYHNTNLIYGYMPIQWSFANVGYSANQKMELDINESGVVTVKQAGNLIWRFQGKVAKYYLAVSSYNAGITYSNVKLTSWTPQLTCTDIDTDQDGVVNRFDLDSDDDGCNDAVESGAAALGTSAPLSGAVGINGLIDTIETVAESGEPKYFSSYPYYALVRTKIVCDDQDKDGIGNITDVDSDNDGVPDDVEQNCYTPLFINEVSDATNKTLSGMMLVGQDSITYKMVATGPAVSYTSTNFVDGNGIHFMVDDGKRRQLNLNLLLQSYANEESFLAPSIKYVDFGPHVPLNRATTGIASDPQNIVLSWPGAYGVVFDPANELSSHNTGDRISNGDLIVQNGTLSFSSAPVPKWKVRLFIASAVDSLNISASIFETGGGGLNNEGYGFNLSACSNNDEDGDNLPNEIDTDSDGDGCSDAYEAGATNVAGTSVISGTYGANGFVSTLESDDTDLATQNYTPSYSRAQNAAFNLCLDTDSDGISNVTDIDDDNDGILDEDENTCGTALFTNPLSSSVSGSRQKFKGTLSKGNAGADYTINLIGVSGRESLFDNSKGGLHYNLTDNNTIFSQTFYILPNSGSAINQINWGVNVTSNQAAGSAVTEAQSITLNWNPDVRARVYDPNDQLLNLATDDLITTGTVIRTRANVNASATTWRLEFIAPGLTVPFFLQTSHSASSTVNADAWGIYAELCYLGDPDGDNVVNSLDLDSDGDSCGDAFEAGATLNPGGASLKLTGSVGTNGLVNTVETNDSQTASINYPSTNFQAYSPTNACADTDNDGIPDREDLDSDNDGIMNYFEYECGTGVFVKSYVISTSTNTSFGATYNNGNFRASTTAIFSNLNSIITLSDNTNAGNFKVNDADTEYRMKALIAPTNGILAGISFGPNLAGNTENANVTNQQQTITLNWNYPIGGYISDPDDQLSSHTDGQGINPGDAVVTRAAYAAGVSTWKMVLPLSFLNTELSFEASFISNTTFGDETWGISADVCNRLTDPDKDGITNATDPDSDGDGCFDAVEAKHNKNETLTSQTVPGPFGQNGLTALLENNDSRFAQTSYSLSLDYTDGLVKGCADLDADLNPDVTDIDDDGDGITDQTECPVDPPLTSYTLVRANSEGSVINIVSNTGAIIGRITSRVPVFRKYLELFARMTPNNLDKSVVGIASDGWGGVGSWWRATKASDLRVGELIIEPVGVAALNLRLVINEGANGPCFFNPRSLKLDAGAAGKGVIKSIPQPGTLFESYKVGDSISRDMPISTAFNDKTKFIPKNKNFIQIQYTLDATVSNPAVIKFTYTSKGYPGIGCDPWGFQILELTPTALLKKCDFDNDGINDDRDFDADNDGCPDAREAGHGAPVITNSNGDPVVGGEVGANGMSSLVENNDTAAATGDYTLEKSENNTLDYLNSSYRLACDAVTAIDDEKTTPEDTPVSGNVITDLNASNEKDFFVGFNKILTITKFLVQGVNYTAGQTATIPGVGTLKINSDGSYTFTPALNYNGQVPLVTYTVSEGKLTDFGDLKITVTPVNDPPVATDNANTTTEDTPVTGTSILIDDSDVDNDQITLTQFEINGATYLPGETATMTGVGTLKINADGTYTFTPELDYNGPVPVATYMISDGKGGTDTATLTILITPAQDAPVALDDEFWTDEEVPVTGNVLPNDSDVDEDALTVTGFEVNGSSLQPGQTATITGKGTITMAATGIFTFTPAANFNGTVPAIPYTISDGRGGTASANLKIIVRPVNDSPVAVDDAKTTLEDTPVSDNVLTNDTDTENDQLSVTSFKVNGVGYAAGSTANINSVGSLVVNANGSWTFTPLPDYNGTVPTVNYTITDGSNQTASANLVITVTPVNDNPVALDDNKSTIEDTPATGSVLPNDSDLDGNNLTVSGFTVGGSQITPGQTGTIANVGTITINTDGTYTFTPAANFNGTVPGIPYTISDGQGGTATAALNIIVTPANDPPVANDDTKSTNEDTPLTGNVISPLATPAGDAADTDPDGTTPTLTAFKINGQSYTSGTLSTIPGVGTIQVNSNGSYTFTPALNYNGTVPPITYTIRDTDGLTDTADLNITVTPVNDPPTAVDDSEDTPNTTPVSGNLITTNDWDIDHATSDLKLNLIRTANGRESFSASRQSITIQGPFGVFQKGCTSLQFQNSTCPIAGSITVSITGAWTFTPALNFTGLVEPIYYIVTDPDGLSSSEAKLEINVFSENATPVAQPDVASTFEDFPVQGNVITGIVTNSAGNFVNSNNTADSDPNAGDVLSIQNFKVEGLTYEPGATANIPGKGTIVITSAGAWTFTPEPNYTGSVPVITYVLSDNVADGSDGTASSTLTITVLPKNDLPVALNDTNVTPEETAVSGNVSTNDGDTESATLTVTGFTIQGDNTNYTAGNTATIAGVGTLVIRADGTYTFTPATNFTGNIPEVTYTIKDADNGTATAKLNILVTPLNDPPVATNDTATTQESTAVSGNVLTTNADTDVDGGALSVTGFKVNGISYQPGAAATINGVGTLVINANGTWNFTPVAGYFGSVPVATYSITDGAGGSASATLSITVTAVNDPPVAVNDINTTKEDTPVSGNIVSNDGDPENDQLTVTSFSVLGQSYTPTVTASIPGYGTLLVNSIGTYTFTPEPNFSGDVPLVTYTISDLSGSAATAIATLYIKVTPVNDPPVATNDTATTPEDTTVSGNVLTTNADTDIDGGTLSVTEFKINGITYTAGTTAAIKDYGTLSIDEFGSWTFVPEPNFNGAVPVATYTISDGRGGTDTATLSITVTPVNDVPLAIDDSKVTAEDTPVSGNILSNDSDPDDDVLTVSSFLVNGRTYSVNTTVNLPGVGDFIISPSGNFTFTPVTNFNGNVPVVTYSISDGNGGTASATLTIIVTPVDDPLEVVNDSKTTTEGVEVGGNVLDNDTDTDGTLSVASFRVEGTDYTPGSTATLSGVGTLKVNADGTFLFTPEPEFNGQVPQASYTVNDGNNATADALLNITVTPFNDLPLAVNDTKTTPEDTPVSDNILTNDSDQEGAVLTVSNFSVSGQTYTPGSTATISGIGTLKINSNGSYTFTPELNYNGPVPTVTYTASDGNGGTATATLLINVTPVNDVPVARNDINFTSEDVPVSANVLPNDSDVDNDVLTVTGFTINGLNYAPGVTATVSGVGTLLLNSSGAYTFTPAANFNGSVPKVLYSISDGKGGIASAELDIVVNPIDDPTVAVNDTNTTPEDTPVSGNVLSNDSDADGPLSVSSFRVNNQNYTPGQIATITGVGTISINTDGSYTFKPALNFNGTVPEISYTAADGFGGSATAKLNITVTPVNDAPVAANDQYSTTEEKSVSGEVIPNDSDIDGDALKVKDFTINNKTYLAGETAELAGIGTLKLNENGSFTFTPALDFSGQVPAASYTVSDASNATATAVLNITVTPLADPPIANDDSKTIPRNLTDSGDLFENDSDPDTQKQDLQITKFEVAGINYNIDPGSQKEAIIADVGVLAIRSDGTYSFIPVKNYFGSVPVATYTISDGTSTDTATLTLVILNTNDPPVAINDSKTVLEDTPENGNVLTNDSDPDKNTISVTGFTINGLSYLPGQTAILTGVGTLRISSDGSWTFTPDPGFNGFIPTATYSISDGEFSAEAILQLTMTPVNDPPVAADDTANPTEDEPVSGNVLGNDADPDQDPLSIKDFSVNGKTYQPGENANIPGIGDLELKPDGSFKFTPAPNYVGPVPSVDYTVKDPSGATDTGKLNLDVKPVEDAPIAQNDTNTTPEEVPVSGNVLLNDSDPDKDLLQVQSFGVNGIVYLPGETATLTGIGTLKINADGSYTFTPAPNYSGPVPSVDYTITDGKGGTDTAVLSLTVTPVNDPPVAVNDSRSTPKNTSATGNVITNDSDPDTAQADLRLTQFVINGTTYTVPAGGSTTATINGVGALTIGSDGAFTFVPVLNFAGNVPAAQYTITDGALTAEARLDILIVYTNDPPVAVNDAESVTEDQPKTGTLFPNDSDPDGDILTVTEFSVNGVSYQPTATASIPGVGDLKINFDGTWTFTPAPNYTGAIPVASYVLSDGQLTAEAKLTLTMIPVNDPPVASDDTANADEDKPATGNVLPNDTDLEGGPLSVKDFSIGNKTYQPGETAVLPGIGSLKINADGSYQFTPEPNYAGPVPPADYTVKDPEGATDTGRLNLNINPKNDPPVATDDQYNVPEDGTLTGALLGNDTDVDGDPLSISGFNINGTNYQPGDLATIPGIGQIRVNPDGSFNFTPEPNYAGPVPPVNYTVSDGKGGTDQGKLSLNVTPANDPPVANDDNELLKENTPLTDNVLGNDTDPENDPLSISGFNVNGQNYQAGDLATIPGVGTFTMAANGDFTFTPATNYTGPVPEVNYTMNDSKGGTDTGKLNLSIVPDPVPVANDDAFTSGEDQPLNGNLLTNDSGPSGSSFSLTNFTVNGQTYQPGQTATIPGVGTLTINANGSFTFNPAPGYDDKVPPVSYTIANSFGKVDTATLNIRLTPVNDTPLASDDFSPVSEDTPASGNLLNNDSDPDFDPLAVSQFRVNGQTYQPGQTASIGGVGSIKIDPDGSWTFTPVPNYNGPIPEINYTATDGTLTDDAKLNLNMSGVNDPPVAADDQFTTDEDLPVSGNVLSNDADLDGGPLSLKDFTVDNVTYQPGQTANIPGKGTLKMNADGSFTFTPEPDYNGPIPQVGYTVQDPQGATDTGALNIKVTPKNDPPVALDDSRTATEDKPLSGFLLSNDSDKDLDPLSVTGFSINNKNYQPGETATIEGVGNLRINSDGSFTFTPAANYNGPVPSADYTISDGKGGTDTAKLNLNVVPANDPPIAADDSQTLNEDAVATGSVLGNDSDIEGPVSVDGFTVDGTFYPAGATAAIFGVGTIAIGADGKYTFTPLPDYNGPVPPIGYSIKDADGATATANLFFTISPVNDPPVARDDSASTEEDKPTTGNVLSNDSDKEGNPLKVTGFTVGGNTYKPGETANLPGIGTFTIDANGKFTFIPVPDFNGSVPTVNYGISDGKGGTDSADLRIGVNPVNDPPVALDDKATATEDTPVSGRLLDNDSDKENDPLTVSGFEVAGANYAPGTEVVLDGVGTIKVNSDGTFIFTPAPNYFGPVPPVDYTITDGNGGTDKARLELNINPVNDPPVANDDSRVVTEDKPLSGVLIGNDSDPELDPLKVSGFEIGGVNYNPGQTANIPGVGTLVINSDGTFTFKPAANYNGTVPEVNYTISDGKGGTDTAKLNLVILPINDLPVANDDAFTTAEDEPVSGNVLPNDTDTEGTKLTVTNYTINGVTYQAGATVTIPEIGTLVLNADGSFTFTPEIAYEGPIPPITYTVTDGEDTDTAVLTIKIDAVIDITANDDNFRFTVINEGTGGTAGNVLDNDVVNRKPAIAGKVDIILTDDGGSFGGIRIEPSGNIIVEPGTKPGTYTITYQICEKGNPNNCDSATAIVEVGEFGILVPEGISPDVDGLNDVWVIRGLENYPKHELTLYNRWGNIIIRRKPYKNDWDGTSDNALTIGGDQRVPAGTYYYVIELGNGKKVTGYVYVAY